MCQLLYLHIVQTAVPEVDVFQVHTGGFDHVCIDHFPPLRVDARVAAQVQLEQWRQFQVVEDSVDGCLLQFTPVQVDRLQGVLGWQDELVPHYTPAIRRDAWIHA